MKPKKQRIGILGGTFDPIHKGHLLLAQAAIDALHLDQVLLLISKDPPHKHTEANVEDRIRMANLAVQNEPQMEVCAIDLKIKGKSYAVNSILKLRQQYPQADFFYLIGSDVLHTVPYWFRYDALAAEVTFLCVRRCGLFQESERDLRQFAKKNNLRCEFLNAQIPDISSSAIRQAYRNGNSVRELLPDGVLREIARCRLYQTAEDALQ